MAPIRPIREFRGLTATDIAVQQGNVEAVEILEAEVDRELT